MLSAEYLRIYSPSAEVVGHASGQEILQLNKENVTILRIQPTGNYAVILFLVINTIAVFILGHTCINLLLITISFGMNIYKTQRYWTYSFTVKYIKILDDVIGFVNG